MNIHQNLLRSFLTAFFLVGMPLLLSAQANGDISVFQFTHMYAWRGGNVYKLDSAEDISPAAIETFWKMKYPEQLKTVRTMNIDALFMLFKSVIYNVVYKINKESKSERKEARESYIDMVRLLIDRYNLNINIEDVTNGKMYILSTLHQFEKETGMCISEISMPNKPNTILNSPDATTSEMLPTTTDTIKITQITLAETVTLTTVPSKALTAEEQLIYDVLYKP